MKPGQRDAIVFLGQVYRRHKKDSAGTGGAIYDVLGKAKIVTWFYAGGWGAYLVHDDISVEIHNRPTGKKFRTESSALRNLEKNVRKLLAALGFAGLAQSPRAAVKCRIKGGRAS